MAEVETPPVLNDDRLIPLHLRNQGTLDRWLEADPDQAMKRLDGMVKMLDHLFALSIRRTFPSDWILHVTLNDDGVPIKQVGYLQDCGAERAAKPWGIEIGQPEVDREDLPDGTYVYHLEAEAWSKATGETIKRCEGSRWSGDPFFQRQIKNEGDKVDPSDVSKAAYSNLHGRAVRSLGGLSAVPIDVLQANGLDTTKCTVVGYGQGGSSTAVGTADIVMPFGNSKGLKVSELPERDLTWYIGVFEKDLRDPSKKKYEKRTQRMLDACNAEAERRARSKSHEAETGTKAPEPQPVAAGEFNRGRVLNETWGRLTAIASQKAPALLKQVTKDLGQERATMSELTDVELMKLSNMADELLQKVWEQISKEPKK